MVPFKLEGNLRNPTQKAKLNILQQYDDAINEYEYQQSLKDEKELNYESSNLL